MLNDPTFVEAARAFAARLLSDRLKSDEERLDQALEQALARPIKPKEKESLKQFFATQRARYRAHPDEAQNLMKVGLAPAPGELDKAELAAWTEVCRVVLNLHETITRY